MSLRLLPFRQYNEHDVINIFSLETGSALASTTDDGDGSNGVIVKVTTGDFNQDPIKYTDQGYLGKNDYSFVGSSMYPINPLTVAPAGSGDAPLGVTLAQTAKNDENGEKLLYNATKKEELQAVTLGESVPVATKGIFTFSTKALAGAAATTLANKKFAIGNAVQIATGSANKGKLTGVAKAGLGAITGEVNHRIIGTVLGTGARTTNGSITDQFVGDYVIVQLDV